MINDHDYIGLLVIVSEWSPSEKDADGQKWTAAGMSSRRAVEAVFRCRSGEILSMISFANACVFFMYVHM